MVFGLNGFRLDRVNGFWRCVHSRLCATNGVSSSLNWAGLNRIPIFGVIGLLLGVNDFGRVVLVALRVLCIRCVDKPNTLVIWARPLFGLVFIGSDCVVHSHPADLSRSNVDVADGMVWYGMVSGEGVERFPKGKGAENLSQAIQRLTNDTDEMISFTACWSVFIGSILHCFPSTHWTNNISRQENSISWDKSDKSITFNREIDFSRVEW